MDLDLNHFSKRVKNMLSSRKYAHAVYGSIHFAVAAESLVTRPGGFHPGGEEGPTSLGLLYFLTCLQAHKGAAENSGRDAELRLKFLKFLRSLLKSHFSPPVEIDGCKIEFATETHDASKDLGEGALVLQYDDKEPPYIIYGNLVDLSLEMLDFLTLLCGYDAFLQQVRSLLEKRLTYKAVQELSNTLNKKIYSCLAEVGADPAHLSKKYRFISSWLSGLKRRDQSIPLADLVNDKTVFDFWRSQNSGAGITEDEPKKISFKTFENVADSFAAFLVAQNAKDDENSVRPATRLNPDTDGKNSSDYLDNFPADSENTWVSLEYLEMMEALGRTQNTSIKAVNIKQHDQLLPVVSMGEAAQKLPLTTARKVLIGRLQSRITQAERRNNEIENLVNASQLDSYKIFFQEYTRLQENLKKTLLALAYALIEVGDTNDASHGLSLLLDQYPNLELSKSGFLRDDWKSDDPGNQASATVDVFSGLRTERLQNPDLNEALRKAESAWKGNNRQGFKEPLRHYDSRCRQFSSLAVDLTRLGHQLAKLMGKLNTSLCRNGGAAAVSDADRIVVQETFRNIYGER